MKATGNSMDEFYSDLTLLLSIIMRPKVINRVIAIDYFDELMKANPQLQNFTSFAGAALLPCEKMLKRCWFNNVELNCCDFAVQSVSEDGICYLMTVGRFSWTSTLSLLSLTNFCTSLPPSMAHTHRYVN